MSPSEVAWRSPQLPPVHHNVEKFTKAAGVSHFLAQLLLNRQLDTPEVVHGFLASDPVLNWPRPDFETELVALFRTLYDRKGLIVIHGDYDADGLTGTTILTEYLRSSGFQVEPFLPTRSLGYGLNLATLERFAESGAQLLITVDCGVSNHKEIARAQELGMQVVITDHHGLGESLPPADFVLHPEVLKIPELQNLSGVGMAYWLAVLLYPHFACSRPLDHWLELAGIGTIADMTPLKGFNRNLVKAALKQIKHSQRPGLLALLQQKQTRAAELDETALAFRVIPLLNAAGRLQSPMLALDLLLAEDPDEAESLAENLNQVNQARREMGQALLDEITAKLDLDLPKGPVILAESGWPFGILGITCSQLVERYGRPVFLMAIDGEIAKASVRAPEGFHVLQALQSCDDLFIKYGGHAQAGGFSIPLSKLEELKQRLGNFYTDLGSPQLMPMAELELNLKAVNEDLWEDLQRLAPFGAGNPLPSFVAHNVPLQKVAPDRKGVHLFAEFSSGLKLKGWNMWQPELAEHSHFDLHFELQQNTWKGRTSLELQLKQIQPHLAKGQHQTSLEKSLENRPDPPRKTRQTLIVLAEKELDLGLSFFHPLTGRYVNLRPLEGAYLAAQGDWVDGRRFANLSPKIDAQTWILRPPADLLDRDRHSMVWENLYCTHLIVQWLPINSDLFQMALNSTQPEQLTFLPTELDLAPPPTFTELKQAQSALAKFQAQTREELPETHLVKALSISHSRARLLMACLADLNLREGASVLSNGRLDLRDSPTFLAYLARFKAAQNQYQKWYKRSFQAFQSWLP
jgi:single-stranded-DNA-specific exonuclease